MQTVELHARPRVSRRRRLFSSMAVQRPGTDAHRESLAENTEREGQRAERSTHHSRTRDCHCFPARSAGPGRATATRDACRARAAVEDLMLWSKGEKASQQAYRQELCGHRGLAASANWAWRRSADSGRADAALARIGHGVPAPGSG